jgi:predicted DNA-binding transcriptional regulator YafY
LEDVVLKFDPDRFPYAVSKPIHHSQEVIDEREHTIKITVRPNKELTARILSFCPQVEVVKPRWLRDAIAEKLKENLKKYSSVQKGCTE